MDQRLQSITVIALLLMNSGVLSSTATASSGCSLPSGPVTLTLVNGTSSYYVAVLSNVPTGYDVADGVYPNWCVDRRYVTVRDTSIEVLLYSSLASPPDLEPHWDMVNYILNHKRGSMMDVQNAIWYFIKMGNVGWWSGFSPSAVSNAIVEDALANGTGYVPNQNELLAVVCYLTTETQITIIEARRSISVGGYSYSVLTASNAASIAPCLVSIMTVIAVLVWFRNRIGTKIRERHEF